MNENLKDLVNQVLQSPELKACIETCLNNPTTSGQGQVTPSSNRNMREELHRLFPSVRPYATPSNSSQNVPLVRNTKKRRKEAKSKPFMKELVLLKRPSCSSTLTRALKARAYDEGINLYLIRFT